MTYTDQATHENNVANAAQILRDRMGDFSPKLALILGSGIGGFSEEIDNAVTISYSDLPGFPVLAVEGHTSEVIIGKIGNTDVLCLKGRKHLYESHDFTPLKTLIRTMQAIGIKTMFSTSASGSLRTNMQPGSIMAIADHINFMGINPLIGPNDDTFGPRFPAMDNAWDTDLRASLHKAAKDIDVHLDEGVYIGFRGPTFETPAEIKMAQVLGADAVGMSSVPECILARHCGMTMIGCAVITNLGAGLSDEKLSHDHTLEGAKLATENLTKLIKHFIANYVDQP